MAIAVDNHADTAGDGDAVDSGDIGIGLVTNRAHTAGVGFSCYPGVTDDNIVITGGELQTRGRAQGNVVAAGAIEACLITVRLVLTGGRVAQERSRSIGRFERAN